MSKTLGMEQSSLDSTKIWALLEALPKCVSGATDEKYLRTVHSQLFEDDKDLVFLLPRCLMPSGDETADHRKK